ncbi:MAG: DNA-deoxyinosine glycosylase [Coxiellaceae bacterium]|nr:DNA-deoxyinosine glycosylase [Coxiellaceae bacterium]
MNNNSQCFNDVSAEDATTLILGSMPGIASLEAQQYYAHPRNAFWSIMQSVTNVKATAPYQQRLDALRKSKIALWDVLASCHRSGSLDSAIQTESIIVNDFKTWFEQHPSVQRVLLNGGKAFELFNRHVISVELIANTIHSVKCPSTSPAYASMGFEAKKFAWLKALSI